MIRRAKLPGCAAAPANTFSVGYVYVRWNKSQLVGDGNSADHTGKWRVRVEAGCELAAIQPNPMGQYRGDEWLMNKKTTYGSASNSTSQSLQSWESLIEPTKLIELAMLQK
ncbi:hypothetical protein N7510_008522 [Penicillium lagena]|uniref:uncharacterized protein n=1 Tax=Penicillium lagena TaxID=94218 RepID=UPI00254082F1|nr:uncharacterized protein N7510_008522 [Penicillium lagena]KAJ5605741.1 hypothetical protein N7510_008522 [Penicillium lagena]